MDGPGQLRLRRILDDIVARAVRELDPEKIWLFGSYARGTATRSSDVDLGFEIPARGRAAWSRFVADSADVVPALVDLDLVDLGTCGAKLASEIAATGRVIYARAPR